MNDIVTVKGESPKGAFFAVAGNLPAAKVLFTFEDVFAARGGIESIVTVAFTEDGKETVEVTQHLSVFNNQSRESFARLLAGCFDGTLKWKLITSLAIGAFSKEYRRTASDGILTAEQIPSERPSFLLEPYLEQGSANLLFSKGGIGKTFLALRIALSVATGEALFGVKPSGTSKVLFLDWENSAKTFKDRLTEAAKNVPGGTEALARCYYKDTKGVPLTEMAESLAEFVKEKGIGLVIVDSAAPACGGAPEEAVTATRYFAALRQIGATSLTIAHESKADNGSFAFGSVFFTNLARNIFNLKSLDEQQGATRHLLLTHKKFNNGPLRPPLTFTMFTGAMGVEFSVAEGVKKRSATEKVVAAIRERGEATKEQIAEDEFLSAGTVKNVLTELKERGAIKKGVAPRTWKLHQP